MNLVPFFRYAAISLTCLLISMPSQASIFGEETAVLLQVVGNQLTELQKLAEHVGVAKDQWALLSQINDGVQRATQQIRAIESIVHRAQGLDPTSVSSLSDLNQAIEGTKTLSADIQELVSLKLSLCDQAVDQAGTQGETAYLMGQEMVKVGRELAEESRTASPGRAQQISASAASAQMLATGIELQTLAQISQLLAMNLDLHKSQMQTELAKQQKKDAYLQLALTGKFPKNGQPPARFIARNTKERSLK